MTDDLERLAELERRIARLEESLRARNSREQKVAAELLLEAEGSPTTAESAIPQRRMVVPTPPSGTATQAPMPRFAGSLLQPQPKRDWEALIGRYGTLILATVTALVGVGTFVGWAISHGLLGPAQRVGLGLVTAAALAVWGFSLRKRERSFGASVIGIALAMVHVCAWGAGPSLHLVPISVAFALAALASLALETFAHLENDEALWSVGFFGAALAPFVTSDGSGNVQMLAAYGTGVLVSGGYALGDRPWRIAGRLFLASATLYVGSLMLGREADLGPVLAVLFPIAVAYLGVFRWTAGWKRRLRLRGLGVLAAAAGLRMAMSIGLDMTHQTMAELIGVAGVAWLGLVALTHVVARTDDAPPEPTVLSGDRFDAGMLPAMFVFASIVALDAWPRGDGIGLIAATAILLLSHIRYPSNGLREGAAVATVACAAGAAALLGVGHPAELYAAVGVVGAAAFFVDRWRPSRWWTGAGMVAMAWGMVGALGELTDRLAYGYTPFFTAASASAAVILAGTIAAWRVARDAEHKALVAGAGVAWAFAWVHQEISYAVNRTVSTLLRVSYYAATSVAAVWVGRARNIAPLRHAGLGLAVIAAGTALYSASDLASIGARVFADLVAAGFLMAIAFWYRKPGVRPEGSEPTGPQRDLV